jgi:N-acetylglucosamine kinase-like BadF-type ATPase
MSEWKLIADSGSTKAEWCLINGKKKKILFTEGISPYFMELNDIIGLLHESLKPKIKNYKIGEIIYYGTGCANPIMAKKISTALKHLFTGTPKIKVHHDLTGAAHALCGHSPGIACILGTGSNSCYYNGKKIMKNSPGLGYVLGDEGSGAYMGKKVLQHFLYGTFEGDLMDKFISKYQTQKTEILDRVYRQPLPNRYLASFSMFLSENRGHYMIENIIEDALNDFFFHHLYKYKESWKYPIHFVGGVAFAYKDVIESLCNSYGLQKGNILIHPMSGLIHYHK